MQVRLVTSLQGSDVADDVFTMLLDEKRKKKLRVLYFNRNLHVDMRKFYKDKATGEEEPGRGIRLGVDQWEAFKACLPRLKQGLAQCDKSLVVELGQNSRAFVSEYRCELSVHVRKMYKKDGKLLPSRAGITLDAVMLQKIMDHMDEVSQHMMGLPAAHGTCVVGAPDSSCEEAVRPAAAGAGPSSPLANLTLRETPLTGGSPQVGAPDSSCEEAVRPAAAGAGPSSPLPNFALQGGVSPPNTCINSGTGFLSIDTRLQKHIRDTLRLAELAAGDCSKSSLNLPLLSESVFQTKLEEEMRKERMTFQTQFRIPMFDHNGKFLQMLKADLLVEDVLLVELKKNQGSSPGYRTQLFRYMECMKTTIGLLVIIDPNTFTIKHEILELTGRQVWKMPSHT